LIDTGNTVALDVYGRVLSGTWNVQNLNQLTSTGITLITNDNAISGKLSTTGTLLSAVIVTGSIIINNPNFTGLGTVFVTQAANQVYISGSASAGAGEINTASNGTLGLGLFSGKVGVDLRFFPISGGTGVIVSLSGGQTIFIDSTVSTANFATTTSFNALSGSLVTTGQTLFNYFTIDSGNLSITGSNLQIQINALSGAVSNTGVSLLGSIGSLSGNLITTGQVLNNKINTYGPPSNIVYLTGTQTIIGDKNLSGNFVTFDPFPSGNGFTGSSGLVFLTGSGNPRFQAITTGNQISVDFYQRILSGNWNVQNLNQLTNSGTVLSAVTITGSSIINTPNFIGMGGLQIILTGNQGAFSGGGGGGVGTTTNNFYFTGQTGFILGLGNALLTSGVIYISGGSGMSTRTTGINNQVVTIDLIQGTFNNMPKFSANTSGLVDSNIYSIGSAVGIENTNPLFDLDVSGSGNFSSGVSTSNVILTKNIGVNSKPASNTTVVYADNWAQRGMVSFANNLGIGKPLQNTFALENIHWFSPNTSTTMNVVGTTATSAGTISHPTTFATLTGAGFCSSFITTAGAGPTAGIQSATTPFYLTSGTTGLGAGFLFATQFQFTDPSGKYPTTSGLGTGFSFFAGMTNAATPAATITAPYNSSAMVGFQFMRFSGTSGRNDNNFKFISKDNGATASMFVQDTNCPFVAAENLVAYVYGRNDYRYGVHWMIKRIDNNLIYSGSYTGYGAGDFVHLPIVSNAAQTMLKPSIAYGCLSGAALNMRLKGLYAETV
jgi:hypothetical protein